LSAASARASRSKRASTVVEASGLAWIPINEHEAYDAGGLPQHHRDPFDRLLIAQALSRSATLVSGNPIFDRYGARRLWSG
jgi:PIN domain nuclease of toxin-antitoxin system